MSFAFLINHAKLQSQTIIVVEDINWKVSTQTTPAIQARLFPNPATDKIIIDIQGADQILSLSALNLAGKQVIQAFRPILHEKYYRLDISDLEEGSYWLKIRTEKTLVTRLFSVVRH